MTVVVEHAADSRSELRAPYWQAADQAKVPS